MGERPSHGTQRSRKRCCSHDTQTCSHSGTIRCVPQRPCGRASKLTTRRAHHMGHHSVLHARIVTCKDHRNVLQHTLHKLPRRECARTRSRRLAAQARDERESRRAQATQGLNGKGGEFIPGVSTGRIGSLLLCIALGRRGWCVSVGCVALAHVWAWDDAVRCWVLRGLVCWLYELASFHCWWSCRVSFVKEHTPAQIVHHSGPASH